MIYIEIKQPNMKIGLASLSWIASFRQFLCHPIIAEMRFWLFFKIIATQTLLKGFMKRRREKILIMMINQGNPKLGTGVQISCNFFISFIANSRLTTKMQMGLDQVLVLLAPSPKSLVMDQMTMTMKLGQCQLMQNQRFYWWD